MNNYPAENETAKVTEKMTEMKTENLNGMPAERLTENTKNKKIELILTDEEINLSNKNALDCTKTLFRTLKSASKNGFVFYGHQNDFHMKAGAKKFPLSCSDTFDVTGHFAGITGIDALCLTGNEYGKWFWPNSKRVKACIKLAEKIIRKKSILTLSAHMPNFNLIYEKLNGCLSQENLQSQNPCVKGFLKLPSVLKDGSVNFTGYTPNNLSGKTMAEIVPGKKLNELYTSYLDLIAGFCEGLQKKNTALMFRPFHENTGGWFWWGNKSCTPEEYKEAWKFIWKYLTEQKKLNNIIWCYSPGSENKSESEILERYPGDEFVDLIGFDMYERMPEASDTFFSDFEFQCRLYERFAFAHGKIFAVTETGIAHENNKALLDSGNEDFKWYEKILECCAETKAAYFLLWANFTKHGAYYSPFAEKKSMLSGKIKGHELIEAFRKMYNDRRILFAGDYKI